jgi:hypothetical protein
MKEKRKGMRDAGCGKKMNDKKGARNGRKV